MIRLISIKNKSHITLNIDGTNLFEHPALIIQSELTLTVPTMSQDFVPIMHNHIFVLNLYISKWLLTISLLSKSVLVNYANLFKSQQMYGLSCSRIFIR